MLDLFAQIEAAAAHIRSQWSEAPRAGIILGTGLGDIASEVESPTFIEYESIPHFPKSTATSHRGRLVCGRLAGVPVVAMEGRFHQYEGYPLKQITLPVRASMASTRLYWAMYMMPSLTTGVISSSSLPVT